MVGLDVEQLIPFILGSFFLRVRTSGQAGAGGFPVSHSCSLLGFFRVLTRAFGMAGSSSFALFRSSSGGMGWEFRIIMMRSLSVYLLETRRICCVPGTGTRTKRMV